MDIQGNAVLSLEVSSMTPESRFSYLKEAGFRGSKGLWEPWPSHVPGYMCLGVSHDLSAFTSFSQMTQLVCISKVHTQLVCISKVCSNSGEKTCVCHCIIMNLPKVQTTQLLVYSVNSRLFHMCGFSIFSYLD